MSSLQRELEFKANFIAKTLLFFVWLVFFFLVVAVIYRNTDSVAGWSRGEALVLASTVFMLGSVSQMAFNSLIEIPEQVRRGTLDFVVTKPIDSQFWVTLRRFNIDRLGSLIAGIGMLVFGLATSGARPDAGQIAAYLVLFTCSVVIYNSFLTMLMTLGIWLVRVENLWVIGEVVQDVARFPADIFASQLKQFLTFVVPFTFIGSISARQLTKGIDLPMVGIGLLWAAIFFGVGRLYWQFALKHYASASS